MRRSTGTVVENGLHLSSLAVGDGYGVRPEANGCYDGRLSLNHGGGDLLLLLGLRGRRTLLGVVGRWRLLTLGRRVGSALLGRRVGTGLLLGWVASTLLLLG